METKVRKGTIRNPAGPERFAEVEGLGSFALAANDPRLIDAIWSSSGWTTIDLPREEVLARIAAHEAARDEALALDRIQADRQHAAMERQAEEDA